jgi:hypothetical protein
MLRHYLKTAWMNLVRNKAHTAINLTGLAVGLTYWGRAWGLYSDRCRRSFLDWWVFVLAAGLVLMIALVTVSFQAVRAALVNPIKSLRSE